MTSEHLTADFAGLRFVLCDLEGVVWLARRPLPGAADAIERLRSVGCRVLFVTNNSMSTIASQEAALADMGVPAVGDVVTSAQAAAFLVDPGERVLVCGGEGVVEAVSDRGATAARAAGDEVGGSFDAVVVGLHDDFDYRGLQAANAAIRGGARFIGTNDDATYPTPAGPTPGAGSIIAAVATASESTPIFAGKPHRPMADLVADRCGSDFAASAALMIGDRASTDGAFAAAIGCPFALVRTGVTPADAEPDAPMRAALDVASLAAVADVVVQ